MSFVKGFLISFILSFLVFAVIILYGGSFALTLVENDDKENEEMNSDNVGSDDQQDQQVYSSHETFSFALVITDAPRMPEQESPEELNFQQELPEDDEQEDSVGDLTPEEPTPQPDDIPGYVTEFEEIMGESDKVLEREIRYICVVSINSTVGKSFITVIPGDTLAAVGSVDMSLSEVFCRADTLLSKFSSDEFIKSTVVASTGIVPDFLGYVDLNDFVNLADELRTVKYTLATDIVSSDPETGDTIVLIPSGEITLNSENLLTLLTYDGYSSRYTDSQVLIDTSKIMLEAICDKFRPNIIAKVREMLLYVDTDFTTSDMQKISNVFFAFKDSEKTAAAMLGAYEDFGDLGYLFRINISGSVSRFKQYLN